MVSATTGVAAHRGLTRLGRAQGHTRIWQEDRPVRKRSFRRRVLRWALLGLVLLASAALLWFFHSRIVALGIVEGEILTFTAPAPVIVQDVYIESGQRCGKGQQLALLVARNAEARRAVLEAQVSQARLRLELVRLGAELDDLRVGKRLDDLNRLAAEMEAAEAVATGAQARAEHAQRELVFYARLDDRGQASTRELDAARTEAIAAEAELTRARVELAGLRARWARQQELAPADGSGREMRQIELALLEDGVEEARQRLHEFDYESGTRTIVAPFSACVGRVYVKPGSHREEGHPLFEIYDPESLHTVAYVQPADRDHLRVGADVRMFPMGSSQVIPGVITEIHGTWARIPSSIQEEFGQAQIAVTMRIECDQASRVRLAPHMILKVVGRTTDR